jgi:hypothetical protein
LKNFPLDRVALAEWAKRMYPQADIDVFGRVYVIDARDERPFYLCFGEDKWIPDVSEAEQKRGVLPDFSIAEANKWPSVTHIIDESDLLHCARDWQKYGKGVNWYHKLHRHYGHMVYHACQATEQLEKQIRLVCEQTVVMKNCKNRRLGLFRAPAAFLWTLHYRVPSNNNLDGGEQHGVFKLPLDGGLENCYKTGVQNGASGQMADCGQKPRGWHIGWIAVPFALFCCCAFALPKVVGWGARKIWGAPAKPVSAVAGAPFDQRSYLQQGLDKMGQVGSAAVGLNPAVRRQGVEVAAGASNVSATTITGITNWKGVKTVYLSDGTVAKSGDYGVHYVGERFAIIGGKTYSFGPPGGGGALVTSDNNKFPAVRSGKGAR